MITRKRWENVRAAFHYPLTRLAFVAIDFWAQTLAKAGLILAKWVLIATKINKQ
jgi:hypothetical protein